MIKEIHLPSGRYLLVSVLVDAQNFKLFRDIGRPYLSYYTRQLPNSEHFPESICPNREYLSPGTWQIITEDARNISEEMARRIVERKWEDVRNIYRDYSRDDYWCFDGTYSFKTLLESNSMSEGKIVLLKDKK